MFDELSSREKEILKILFYAKDFVKAEKISNQVGKSLKTIRNDINNIKKIAAEYDFHIISKTHCGYRLMINNYEDFTELISNYNDEINDYSVRKERLRFYEIAFYILMLNRTVTIEELEIEFYFSRSVLLGELNSVRFTLAHFSIKLIINKDDISMQGDEFRKRILLAMLINTKRFYKRCLYQHPKSLKLNQEVMDVENLIAEVFAHNTHSSLSDVVIKLLATYLWISDLRNNLGFYETLSIPDFDDIMKLYPHEYDAAMDVINVVSQKTNKSFSDQDACVLTILLISYVYPLDAYIEGTHRHLDEMINGMLNELSKYTKMDTFRSDPYMKEQLYAFFYSKELRSRFLTYDLILSPLKYKRRNPCAMELAYHLYSKVSPRFQFTFAEREIVLLSQIFSNMLLEVTYRKKEITIAVVSKYGMMSSKRLIEMFRLNYIHFHGKFIPMEPYVLKQQLSQVDLVVTNYTELSTDVPTFFIHDHPHTHEILELLTFIRKNILPYSNLDSIQQDHVRERLKLKTRKEVLQYIDKLYYGKTKSNIIDELVSRDDLFPYEVGNRCALLCIHSKKIQKNQMYFLVLHKPILWQINYVQLVIVYFTEEDVTQLFAMNGLLSALLSNQEQINRFIRNPEIASLSTLLQSHQ